MRQRKGLREAGECDLRCTAPLFAAKMEGGMSSACVARLNKELRQLVRMHACTPCVGKRGRRMPAGCAADSDRAKARQHRSWSRRLGSRRGRATAS